MDPLAYLFGLEQFGIKFGLETIATLCAGLGHPQNSFRSVLVAGTNGKGSVTAMVDGAARAAGLRAARYTSPHLVRVEERFVIEGAAVSTAALRETIADVRAAVERLEAAGQLGGQPTFFEITTAVAFELFRRARTELAVLEVGLGGRLDATNVVQPEVAAITSIDLDHERHLGTTIDAIAGEKAGIAKPGVPVIVGERKMEALDAIARVCRARRARLVSAWDDVEARATMREGRVILELATAARRYGPITLGLRGRHQVANAVVAVRLLETLAELGFPISEDAIVAGLTEVSWPGRLDLRPLGTGGHVLFDAAHNPAGARVLAAYLEEVYPAGLPLVFGAMQDKDSAGMLAALLPHATHAVLTQARTRRSAPPEMLAEQARRLAGHLPIHTELDPRSALARARTWGPTVCVAGSIFLVGGLLDAIGFDASGPV